MSSVALQICAPFDSPVIVGEAMMCMNVHHVPTPVRQLFPYSARLALPPN